MRRPSESSDGGVPNSEGVVEGQGAQTVECGALDGGGTDVPCEREAFVAYAHGRDEAIAARARAARVGNMNLIEQAIRNAKPKQVGGRWAAERPARMQLGEPVDKANDSQAGELAKVAPFASTKEKAVGGRHHEPAFDPAGHGTALGLGAADRARAASGGIVEKMANAVVHALHRAPVP